MGEDYSSPLIFFNSQLPATMKQQQINFLTQQAFAIIFIPYIYNKYISSNNGIETQEEKKNNERKLITSNVVSV